MIINDKIHINSDEVEPYLSKLCEAFTYSNPELYEKKKLKLSTKGIADKLYHYQLDFIHGNRMVVLPRGALPKVKQFFKDNKLTLKIIDKRKAHKKINVELVDTILESQQKKVIKVLLENEGGLIEMAPGGGKSISILGLISELKQPTLILVHEHRLSKQWMGEIKTRLKGKFKLGELNGDKKEDGDVVVGIINTCYNMFKEDPSYFDKFGMVIVDETHHIAAPMFTLLVNNLPAYYRIGVTGTVKRKDGLHILIYDIIGKELIKIDDKDIKHRITNFDYKIVNTNIRMEIPSIMRWTGRKREPAIDNAKMLGLLTEDVDRNTIIISEIEDLIEKGYFPLVLSDRVEHNKKLAEHIEALGYKVILLIGETRKKVKWDVIQKDDTIQCIVANTKIASEGLDLPRLSAIVLTCPTSNFPQLKQRIGRIRRFLKDKILPLVVDIVDNSAYFIDQYGGRVNILSLTANKRIKYYKQLQREYLLNPEEEQGTIV